MKKNQLLFFVTLMISGFLFTACDKTKTPTPPKVDLNVNTETLNFPIKGGVQEFTVTAAKNVEWDVYSNASWIKLGKPNFETGKVSVTIDPCTTDQFKDMEGDIVIYAGSDFTKKVNVVQKGYGIIHDRSTASRMNLKGDVSTVSYYVAIMHLATPNAMKGVITDLEFDENGMLTSFKDAFKSNILVNNDITIEYNNDNSINKVTAISSNAVVGSDRATFTVEFEYGDHGQYVELDRVYWLLSYWLSDAEYRVWAPNMIKNLTKIKVYNNAFSQLVNFSLDFDINGNNGNCYLKSNDTNPPTNTKFITYTFENGFTKMTGYLAGIMGMDFPVEHFINTNYENGNIIDIAERYKYQGEYSEAGSRTYMDNFINSPTFYFDISTGHNDAMEYNDNYDVIKLVNITEVTNTLDFEYEYDEVGNWINVTGSIDKTREIVYRK